MTQTTHTRRNFLTLAGSAALTPLFPVVAKAQGILALEFAASLEPIADLVDLGLATFNLGARQPAPRLADLSTNSQSLVQSQELILQGMRDLNVAIPQEIDRAFREDHKRHLQAEIDDFRILTANGTLPEADRNIYEKARRLERLSVTMADYGPSALPSFIAANALLYAVNKSLGRDAQTQSLLYQTHASTLDNWLENDTNGFVGRYMDEHRLQLGRRLTGDSRSRIQAINVGFADYRDGDTVQRSLLKLRIHQQANGQIRVFPVVHETIDISNANAYLRTNNLTEQQFADKGLRITLGIAPADFKAAFPALAGDNVGYSDVRDMAYADQLVQNFVANNLARPMENSVNGYAYNRNLHDGNYEELKAFIDTIESVSGRLKQAANQLTHNNVRPRPTLLQGLPAPR